MTQVTPRAVPMPAVMAPTKTHARPLPLRVGTRASPLARAQTALFLDVLRRFCPVLRGMDVFDEQAIVTTGDAVQDRSLAEIGGKGLFAKEIHEALLDRRIDFAVHSLKDLETKLPDGIVLACTLAREEARDALIVPNPALGPERALGHQAARGSELAARGSGLVAALNVDPLALLPPGAVVGTASVRRQAQLLHRRPDLRCVPIRGNVATRLGKVADGACAATLLALAGLARLGLAHRATVVLDPERGMVPAAGQGIIGITVRADDRALRELLGGIEDPVARAVSTAERALLAALDGSCRTPIGGHARIGADGVLTLTGLVARADGSFLLRRTTRGPPAAAAALGQALGQALRADSPADILA